MKKLLMLVVFVFVAGSVFATDSDPATGVAKAKIVAPLAISHASSDALNFGTIVSPSSGTGTVTLTAAADTGATYSSGLEHLSAAVSSDHFTVTNTDDVPYSVSLDASTTVSNGSVTMNVTGLEASCSSNCHDAHIYVGGQLSVGQNQASGDYQGSYSIHLTY